jgi:hypothetical protein
VPIDKPVVPHPVTLTSGIPLADSTVGIITVCGPPFTVQVFTFLVNRGQTVTISYSSSLSDVLMSYMQYGDTVWTTLPNVPVTSAQGTIVLSCNGGNAVKITMVFSSTDDVDVAKADIAITQVSKDDTCECKQPGAQKRGWDSCPASATAAASSTISSVSSPSSSATACTAVASQLTSDP